MECILPGWASYVGMIAMILVAGGAAVGVISWCGRIGERRHPAITFDDHHSRKLWNSLGVFLGIFAVFPVVGAVFLEVIRTPMCEAMGEYRERPVYQRPDFGELRRSFEEMLREPDQRQ
jgi:hypothetical protein